MAYMRFEKDTDNIYCYDGGNFIYIYDSISSIKVKHEVFYELAYRVIERFSLWSIIKRKFWFNFDMKAPDWLFKLVRPKEFAKWNE